MDELQLLLSMSDSIIEGDLLCVISLCTGMITARQTRELLFPEDKCCFSRGETCCRRVDVGE